MTGELARFNQVPAELVDRLVAYCYVSYGPDAGRDAAIAKLRDVHNIAPEQGIPVVDAAIRRSYEWSREQAEALSDQAQGWMEPPVPLAAMPVLPTFPAGIFPPWIEAEISALAESTQTPRDLSAMVVLGVLATGCGGRATVKIAADWSEPTNLYAVPAMASGTRKSTVYATLTAPLMTAEKMLADASREAITEARSTRAIADKAATAAEKAAAVAAADPDKSAEDKKKAAANAVAMIKLAEEIEVPVVPRLVAGDITPEKMAQLLSEQGGRLAVISDEGGPLVSLAGRYSTSKEPDAEVWLTGHSGYGEIRVDRIGRPPDRVKNPALTVCLAVQPVVLRRLYRIPQLRDRGLLARFLYAMPPDNVGYRRTRTTPVSSDVAAAYMMRMTEVATTLASWTDPMVLQLDGGAQEKLHKLRDDLEPRLRPDADLCHMREWAGKLAGAAARIAGLLHVAQHVGEAYKYMVSEQTMGKAIMVGEYLTEHAIAAFSFMGADPAIEDAREVLGWLRRKRLAQFTQRDIHRAMPSRFRKPEDAESVLELLAKYGWIREAKQERRPGRGRPPSPLFDVHPKLLREETL